MPWRSGAPKNILVSVVGLLIPTLAQANDLVDALCEPGQLNPVSRSGTRGRNPEVSGLRKSNGPIGPGSGGPLQWQIHYSQST